MTLYLDTSSLVKLYVPEDGAAAIRELAARAAVLVTSAVTYAEARSTFARCRRERILTPAESAAVIRQFDLDWDGYVAIDVTDGLLRAAGALADRLGLRGFDAIQLTSFEQLLARADDEDIRFLSADVRLSRAAKALG